MNRGREMVRALNETPGQWVPRDEIFRRQGRYALLNNAASDARKQGFNVEHRLIDGQHCYRLSPAGQLSLVAA